MKLIKRCLSFLGLVAALNRLLKRPNQDNYCDNSQHPQKNAFDVSPHLLDKQ
jgi:hypothetical protein